MVQILNNSGQTKKNCFALVCCSYILYCQTQTAAYGLNENLFLTHIELLEFQFFFFLWKSSILLRTTHFILKHFPWKSLSERWNRLLICCYSWPHTDTYFAYLLTFFVPNHRTLLSMQDYLDWKCIKLLFLRYFFYDFIFPDY